MTTVQDKLKLKRVPSNIWSIREQLCLASSVVKTGDQNWISVSRAIKQVVDKDFLQSPDRYSQKSCAQQYSYLMENADAPKRKKKESSETISESIVRRLTQDRITELTKILAAQREEYFQLRNEVYLLKNGTVSDEKLQKMWLAIDEERNKSQIVVFNKKQQNKGTQSASILNVQNIHRKIFEPLIESDIEIQIKTEDEDKKENKSTIKSSLLTSLLKSQSSTSDSTANSITQIQNTTTTSPTIASLLSSSPKVPEPQTVAQNIIQLHQITPNTYPNLSGQERPSASAPTLSMLLEQPSTRSQKVQNESTLINSKETQIPTQVQNTVKTRSSRFIQSNNFQTPQISIISDAVLTNAEIPQIIANPIDEVIQMNKDEINEMIGDLEELIKEEITGSPKMLEPLLEASQSSNDIAELPVVKMKTENQNCRKADKSTSLSNSPASEISIGEIVSNTSNIAEIIGTTIGGLDSIENISNSSKETKESSKFISNDDYSAINLVTSKGNNIHTEVTKSMSEEKNQIRNIVINQYKMEQDDKKKEKKTCDYKAKTEKTITKYSIAEDTNKSNTNLACDKESLSETKNFSLELNNISNLTNHDKNQQSHYEKISDDITIFHFLQEEEKKKLDKNKLKEESEKVATLKNTGIKKDSKKIVEMKDIVVKQEIIETSDNNSSDSQKGNEDAIESIKNLNKRSDNKRKKVYEGPIKESSTVKHCKTTDYKKFEEDKVVIKNESVLTKNKIDESIKMKTVNEDEILNYDDKVNQIKVELKKEDIDDITKYSNKEETEIKKENESSINKENLEIIASSEEMDEEEPVVNKLSAHRAMKTYSKKQSTIIDSEPENEASGETADYKSWKKLIMSVYNTLATHKYASIFLRPITEDQAPGYHSIIFRPMDLSTIKKNIDNGTIRSTTHFQRDVMLMFQNAIMFNKHNTFVHKMTLEMREECLQHMQIFVQAAGEASSREHNRRETRTATNICNETPDNILKRKWVHMASSPHEIESPRIKKRKKSEND